MGIQLSEIASTYVRWVSPLGWSVAVAVGLGALVWSAGNTWLWVALRLPWAAWTYSFAKKRKVYGLHIVVLFWRSSDGHWRIPVAFRLWRPRRSCAKSAYRSKLQLAEQMLKEVLAAHLSFDYLVVDTHYTAGWFTKLLGRLVVTWVGTLHPRTTVV